MVSSMGQTISPLRFCTPLSEYQLAQHAIVWILLVRSMQFHLPLLSRGPDARIAFFQLLLNRPWEHVLWTIFPIPHSSVVPCSLLQTLPCLRYLPWLHYIACSGLELQGNLVFCNVHEGYIFPLALLRLRAPYTTTNSPDPCSSATTFRVYQLIIKPGTV